VVEVVVVVFVVVIIITGEKRQIPLPLLPTVVEIMRVAAVVVVAVRQKPAIKSLS